MTFDPIRLGVIGLGRAFMLTKQAFVDDARVQLVAACAPRAQTRAAFEVEFGARTYEDVSGICADKNVEVLYVATPHQMHADHVIAAAQAGKHVLVDKPMAISMDDGLRMVAACRDNNVHLIVGPSHSFDAAVGLARAVIDSGDLGRVRMIHAQNFTDFLYRPRRPEELRTEEGGGVIFSQAAHQVDIVRLLAGGFVRSVVALTGNWDPDRDTEGAYSALINFDSGAFASLTYSGYAHYDTDEAMGWISELGHLKGSATYGTARAKLGRVTSENAEIALKQTRTYGTAPGLEIPQHGEHFGPLIVCCDRGDIRLTPDGIWIYSDESRRFVDAPEMLHPRTPVVDALVAALRKNSPPVQNGAWGLANLEICHAILTSAKTGQPVVPRHQISTNGQEYYHE